MMANAWNMVPTSVMLSDWKIVRLFASYHSLSVTNRRMGAGDKCENFTNALSNGTVFETDQPYFFPEW